MKNNRNTIFYFVVTGGFTALIYLILRQGKSLEIGKNYIRPVIEKGHWNDFVESLSPSLW
jgi:hypothetical protein